jgi:hypothetical protein
MLTFHQHPLTWIDPIDFEWLKRVTIDVKCVELIVCASPLGQRSPAQGFNCLIIWIVPPLHDDNMLDVSYRASAPIVQNACALARDAMPAG